MRSRRTTQSWEDWAALDPYWAILTDPTGKGGAWDRDAFFRSGEETAAHMLESCQRHSRPDDRHAALDYGCGLGRITRALAGSFDATVGVDASSTMVDQAKLLNRDRDNLTFLVADSPSGLNNNAFDLVSCLLVLQHLAGQELIVSSIEHLVRTLAPKGMLVFQLPHRVRDLSWRDKVRGRSRLYTVLRFLGIPRHILYERLRLHPEMTMRGMVESDVVGLLDRLDASLLEVERQDFDGTSESRTYYVTKAG